MGAGKLLDLPREKIVGHSLEDFALPSIQPQLSALWNRFLKDGEQEGTLELSGPDGTPRDVDYLAKTNVLPSRHLLVLRDKTKPAGPEPELVRGLPRNKVPACMQDYALSLLDVEGRIVAWYSGAVRMYGYEGGEVIGQPVSFFYPEEDAQNKLKDELKRAAFEGHAGTQGWRVKKDGARFWANVITMALKDQNGVLQGFARVVRDFSDRHERDEKLRRGRGSSAALPAQSTIAGIVNGEFDQIPEANEAFLNLVGYTQEDLQEGRLRWPDLTPPEYLALDELAHEEGLRFGACTPFEKELIRKDGSRVAVQVATAVLKLSPFRWITFVQDLTERGRFEELDFENAQASQGFAGGGPDRRSIRP